MKKIGLSSVQFVFGNFVEVVRMHLVQFDAMTFQTGFCIGFEIAFRNEALMFQRLLVGGFHVSFDTAGMKSLEAVITSRLSVW